jgi:hypothetical protein
VKFVTRIDGIRAALAARLQLEEGFVTVCQIIEERGETYHPRNAESERTQSASMVFNHSTSVATLLSFVLRKEDSTSMLFWRSTR